MASDLWANYKSDQPDLDIEVQMKVLQVNHFYIFPEISGGHKRAAAMNKAFIDAGFETFMLSMGPGNPSLSKKNYWHVNLDEILTKLELGWLTLENTLISYRNEKLENEIQEFIKRYQPDVVVFEHPWWFPFFQRIFQRMSFAPVIIYSSYNVESALKRDILKNANVAEDIISPIENEIEEVERSLARRASAVVTVTKQDASWFQKLGASHIIVAENRIRLEKPTEKDATDFQKIANENPYLMFVGSAHPPNVTGLLHMLGPNFGFIPPGAKLALFGGIAHAFNYIEGFQEFSQTNKSRVLLFPNSTDSEIAAGLQYTSGVILPIVSGGGSNLKTVEALLAGRAILATRKSFFGHENFQNDPLVQIEDNPSEFRKGMIQLLSAPPKKFVRDQNFVGELSWEKQLNPVVAFLKKLFVRNR